jgi:glycosyltransferase involved in cell wall biosynthesis
VLVGGGILWDALRERIAHDGLHNVRLIAFQPFAVVPQIYGASDVCVVSQAVTTGTDAVPSKVYRIMSCRRPVLAATDPASDLAQLVRDAGCGAVVPQQSADQLAAAIRAAFANQPAWRDMGERGRQHVLEHYARPVVTAQYHQLIGLLAAEARS